MLHTTTAPRGVHRKKAARPAATFTGNRPPSKKPTSRDQADTCEQPITHPLQKQADRPSQRLPGKTELPNSELGVTIEVHLFIKQGEFIFKQQAIVLLLAAGVLTGCASTGQFSQSTGTDVSLRGNNYKVVKAGAKGESSGFYLFGFIPIVSPNYADAKANLYSAVGESLEGRSVALANQTQDKSTLYLILFSIPKVTVTADIVEFNAATATDPGAK